MMTTLIYSTALVKW